MNTAARMNGFVTNVREAGIDDIPWMCWIAAQRYGDRITDPNGIKMWLHEAAQNPEILLLRGDHSLLVSGIQRYFYAPDKPDLMIVFVAAEPGKNVAWEIMSMLKLSAEWGRQSGAHEMQIESRTDVELAPLAKRLGAVAASTTYTLKL